MGCLPRSALFLFHPDEMPPALSGDAKVKNGVFTPGGEKYRRILKVGEIREKSPNDKCEGIVNFNINLTSP
ncbi:hypothetical protein Tco_0721433 [Tanacetum coccineum]